MRLPPDLDPWDNATPWAELWIGDHPRAPSSLLHEEGVTPLRHLLSRSPSPSRRKSTLPFLLKLLSVEQPLSIQVHPDTYHAKRLHESAPQHYPDALHKPEIVVALDELVVFAGFKREGACTELCRTIPELAVVLDLPPTSQGRSLPERLLLGLIEYALRSSPREIAHMTDTVIHRISREGPVCHPLEKQVFLDLAHSYRGDIGPLMVLTLQMTTLQKGQALFLPPGVPHAYVHGNALECMATSDNVVRMGLTHKFIDLANAREVIRGEHEPLYFDPQGRGFFEYTAPVDEFRLFRWAPEGEDTIEAPQGTPQIAVIINGSGTMRYGRERENHSAFHSGDIFFIPEHLTFSLTIHGAGEVFLAAQP